MKRICVFSGSNLGAKTSYVTATHELGELLAREGIGLVYGGGNIGLMGILADAALEAGGEVIGVIPETLINRELAHRGLTELHIVQSLHERRAKMMELADGFIAVPGGYNTIEEFCEVLTWAQYGFHQKPCGLLNIDGYFYHLLAMFNHAVGERFMRPHMRSLVLEDWNPHGLLEKLLAYEPVTIPTLASLANI
ncbi:MAG TPA: TIGR00730 family Rossman fold protein [Leptolyngbyaceae cyanobacterium M33_DOE_097]|nr:TIGR00730 family Rossman fold protein [Leptolyngbyaceae cyanobacterium M33_DOE_097]